MFVAKRRITESLSTCIRALQPLEVGAALLVEHDDLTVEDGVVRTEVGAERVAARGSGGSRRSRCG